MQHVLHVELIARGASFKQQEQQPQHVYNALMINIYKLVGHHAVQHVQVAQLAGWIQLKNIAL